MSKFSVIWKDTYSRNVKSLIFIFMIIVPILVAIAGRFVADMMSNEAKGAQERTVGIVTKDTNLVSVMKETAPNFKIIQLDESSAIKELSDDKIDGYLTLTEEGNIALNKKATSREIDMQLFVQVFTSLKVQDKAVSLGYPPQTALELVTTQANITVNKLQAESLKEGKIVIDNEQSEKDRLRTFIAYGAVMLLYVFLINYSSVIGQEIATEKGTRVMEVILSSTDARTHFLGKITGIGLVILTQLAVYAILGGGYLFLNQDSIIALDQLWELGGTMILYTLLFILIGCFLYVVIAALMGSVASKIEDVQKVLMPILLFDILGLYIGMFALNMPNSDLVKIASWVPLLTPMVMPFRIATETVSQIELCGSISLTLVCAFIMFKVAISFYKSNVLVYSDKGPLQVLKQSLSLRRSEVKR